MSLRSLRLGLALLIAASISCNDTVTGPAAIAPEGAIVLGDSVLTRGAVVRASIAAPTGYVVVPGSVEWTITGGTAPVIGIGGSEDSVDVALGSEGALQIAARYKVRGNIGAGSSVTIVGPSSRSNGDVVVQSTRSVQVASPLLDYEVLPPASITAGTPFGEVRVTLKDALGRVLTGATDSVAIALDPSSGTAGATLLGTVRTKAVAGVATFRGKSIQRAGAGYRLIATSPTVTSRDTARTTVVAAAPSASQSALVVRDTILTVGAGTTVTVTLRDQYGNPVLTATPAAFLASGSQGVLDPFTCVNGVCTATYTAAKVPGTPTVSATIAGAAISGAPRPVSVRAGAATRLKIAGDTTQVAGASNVIEVTALDAFGNVATGYSGTKRLTFAGASLAPIGTAPKIANAAVAATVEVSFAAGVAKLVTSVLLKAERALLETTDGTIAAAGDDRLPVRVIANVPDAGQSTIVVADSSRFSGQTTTVTITLRDAFGNPVLDGDASSFTPSVSAGTLGSFTCVLGVCTATYTAPPANGPQTVTAKIGETAVAPAGPTTVRVIYDTTAPTITGPSGGAGAAASTKSVPENTRAVHTFTADETATWSIGAGGDSAQFAIDPTTGALVFVTPPNFERPTDLDEDNVYVVTIRATDLGGNVTTQVVTITVSNLDELVPRITGPSGAAGDSVSGKDVRENTTPVHTFAASEEVTWGIDGGADAAAFAIDAVTGALTFRAAPDFEAPIDAGKDNRYIVVVAAEDPAGNVGRQTVTVTVTDVDEVPPTLTGPSGGAGAPTSTKTLPENTAPVHTFTANEPVTWSLDGGADAARFAIDPSTGALTFLASPDFEVPTDADRNNVYIVTIKATDGGGNVTTQTLTITITNIDETRPVIEGPSGFAGDATSGKSVPEGTRDIHIFTALEDAEWSLDGGADAGAFTLNRFSGALTLKTAPDFELPTDADGNNTYIAVIKATDPAGNVSRQVVTVTVTDVDDTPPAITGPSGGAGAATSGKAFPENSTAPVHTFTANEPATWSLDGGADAARFAIDPATGVLTFLAPPDFDAPSDVGADNTYEVVIKAVDRLGNVSRQTLTVTISDVDDTPPVISGPTGGPGAAASTKSFPENSTAAVHTFTATDASAVAWRISGGEDASKFDISAGGALTFKAAPNFEAPTDGATGGSNTYLVEVEARDAAGNVARQTVTITVTNENEAAKLVITVGTASTTTMVAGDPKTITITAYDAAGAVETGYTGSKSLTFSGASVAPDGTTNPKVTTLNFGVATPLTFDRGVVTAAMTLFAAETAIIATTDGTIGAAGADRLTADVSANNASPVVSSLSPSPATIAANGTSTSTLTLQLKDAYRNPTTTVASSGPVSLVRSAGTGTLIGTLTNAGGGTYTQQVQSPASAGSGTFKASINGTLTTPEAVITYVTGPTPLDRVVCTASQPAGQSAASSVTVTLCGATVQGDLEIVTLALDLTTSNIDDISAPTAPLDGTWTKVLSEIQGVRGGGNKPMLFVVYARRYVTGLNRTVTFTGGTNHKWSVDMVTFRSASTGVPSGGEIQIVKNGSGSGLTSPGLVAGADNTIVMYAMANSGTGNLVTVAPNGLTALANNNTGGTSSTSFIELLANGATAPSRSWTSSVSANTVLMQLLVRP